MSSPGRWGVTHKPRFSCCFTSSSSPGRLRDGSEYLLRAPSQPLMNEWVSKLQQNSGERPLEQAPRCRSPFGAGYGMDEPKHGCLWVMQAPALPRELRVPASRIWRLGFRTAHTQLGIRNNRADVSRGSAAKKKQPQEDYKWALGFPCPSSAIPVGLGAPSWRGDVPEWHLPTATAVPWGADLQEPAHLLQTMVMGGHPTGSLGCPMCPPRATACPSAPLPRFPRSGLLPGGRAVRRGCQLQPPAGSPPGCDRQEPGDRGAAPLQRPPAAAPGRAGRPHRWHIGSR